MLCDPETLRFRPVNVVGDEVDELLHHTVKHLGRSGERRVLFKLLSAEHDIASTHYDLGKHNRIVLNLLYQGQVERSIATFTHSKDRALEIKSNVIGDTRLFDLTTTA